MAGIDNLKPWKPGQSGNPNGKPKGALSLARRIQNLLNDEDFETYLQHPTKGYVEFKGAPVEAIIKTAITKAAAGDDKAREWLAKYSEGQKVQLSNDPEAPISTPVSPEIIANWTEFLKTQTKDE